MMRRAGLLLWRGAGGQEAQVAIELQGVGADDLAVDLARQAQGEDGLAAGGGAADQEQLHQLRLSSTSTTSRRIGLTTQFTNCPTEAPVRSVSTRSRNTL